MSSFEVHQAGVTLEQIVASVRAVLRGHGASNSADYYDYGKGIYDGVASCLEAIRKRSRDERRAACLDSAIQHLRGVDPQVEDPDSIPHVVSALVALLDALHQGRRRRPRHRRLREGL